MTQEALKLALEVNENMKDVLKQVNELIAENKALKETLAQTQEPLIGCVNHDCDKCQAQKACVYCGQLVAKEKNT